MDPPCMYLIFTIMWGVVRLQGKNTYRIMCKWETRACALKHVAILERGTPKYGVVPLLNYSTEADLVTCHYKACEHDKLKWLYPTSPMM